jgi:hypothetical protein
MLDKQRPLLEASPNHVPPMTIALGIVLGVISLMLNVWTLHMHFQTEVALMSKDCKQGMIPLFWAVFFLQVTIPGFLLFKIARGWIWARETLVVFLIIVQSALSFGLVKAYSLQLYILVNSFFLLSCLSFFSPAAKHWLQLRSRKRSSDSAKPWIIIAVIAANGIALALLASATYFDELLGLAFSLSDGGYFTSCPKVSYDLIYLAAFWLCLPYQMAIPGALLLFAISSRRRWAVWLYTAMWTAFSALAVYFATKKDEFDFLETFVFIGIGVVEGCVLLFFLPASRRWLKVKAA